VGPRLTKLAASGLLGAVCALSLLSPAGAAADPVSGGRARLQVSRDFSATLRRAGVRLSARGPARLHGRLLELPVTGGELTAGAGQVRLGGGLRLSAGHRGAALSHLVLDTGSGVLIGELSGRQVLLASARRPREKRHNFGYEVTLGKLVLTDSAAGRLDRGLGRPGLLSGQDVLGTATAGIRFSELTVTGGTGYLTLSEGFWAKLRALEVGTEPIEGAWVQSQAPPSVALPKLHGTIVPDLSGGLIESTGGLRLFVGQRIGGELHPVPGAPEVTMRNLAVALETRTATAETAAPPAIGAETAPIGSLSEFPILYRNAFTGEIAFAADPVALSPSLAGLLNKTLAESRGKPATFVAGETLGRINFDDQTH
jgi:hypothetical protein